MNDPLSECSHGMIPDTCPVATRLVVFEQRLTTLSTLLQTHHTTQIELVKGRLDSGENRFCRLEQKIDSTAIDISSVRSTVESLSPQIKDMTEAWHGVKGVVTFGKGLVAIGGLGAAVWGAWATWRGGK